MICVQNETYHAVGKSFVLWFKLIEGALLYAFSNSILLDSLINL